MTNEEIMNKYLEIVQQLDKIIWWCQVADNPIYNVDENGKRHPRDLYEIRKGFAQRYNQLSDALEREGV